MLDSFAVRHKLSRGRVRILRVTTFITLVAITTYNYITTCTQYYDSIFSQNCSPTLIPAGSQFLYRRFTMTNGAQLLYNASRPQNCSLEDVVIQSWFAATALPTFKINMHMTCDNDFNLTVNDFTFDFWNEDYNTISQTAGFLRKFSYCTSNTSAPPYDALEYKYNSTFAYNGETYWNNVIRLFNVDGACNINATVNVDRSLFNSIMDAALDDVRNNTLPGIRYLCNKCGSEADWTVKIGSPLWQLFYNTLNTVGSIVALLVIAMTFGMNDQLYGLLGNKEVDMYGDTEMFLK